MNLISKLTATLLTAILFAMPLAAQKGKGGEIVPQKGYKPPVMNEAAAMNDIVRAAVMAELEARKGEVKQEQVSATVIDVTDANSWKWGAFRGEEKYYPASVPKMFYMAAVERQLEDGKVTLTKELDRGLRDMIVDSSNDATQYIVDVLTDTASGSELPQKEFERWQYKRNRMNRYFAAMGYKNININQKIYCEDAYGIEQQSRNYAGQNRNMLTTNATARAIAEIVLGRLNSPARTERMLNLLKRDPFSAVQDPDSQDHGFIGKMLADNHLHDVQIWSKAGWTSRARHDAAFLRTEDGRQYAIAIFTEGRAKDRELVPAIAWRIYRELNK
jgi:beta-lactamase class A